MAMPELDGLALTRAIRARTNVPFPPAILVLTARQTPADVAAGYDAGADDYVAKPFDARELLARLDVQLRLRRFVVEAAERERLASLGTLAAEVAHGIRNPLNVVKNGLVVVQRALPLPTPDPAKRAMTLVSECLDRIQGLTGDLLDLSGIEREAVSDVSPGDGLESACRMIQSILPSGARLETDIDHTPRLAGRGRELNLVFVNILDNAVKAIGEDGVIAVRGRREGASYVVDIEDSGPGLDPKIAARIFEPFVTSRLPGEGTGLGLSIARRIVEQHGGRLAATSSSLGGARLSLALPLADA
ncbi:ATP-binding protein [Myxococcota bacterium]|nr:ATP-binding protein [Myxococcota bacterium]